MKLKPENENAIVYLVLMLLTTGVAIFPLRLPFEITEMTNTWYNILEGLDEGEYVLVDEGSLNWFTNTQISIAFFRHIKNEVLEDGAKLVVFTTAGTSGFMAMDRMWDIVGFDDMEYGVDWVWLGWLPGGEKAFAAIRDDPWDSFETDYQGTKLEDLPIMDGFRKFTDLKIAIRACNTSPDDFMRQWGGKGVTVLCSNGASAIPLMMPYIESGDMAAYMTTQKQCAEYEKLLGYVGLPTRQMDAQSVGQLYLIGLIVFGNIQYWSRRMKEG